MQIRKINKIGIQYNVKEEQLGKYNSKKDYKNCTGLCNEILQKNMPMLR